MVLGRCDHPWGIEITGFGRPFGVGVDADRRLHITDMDLHLVVRFDAALQECEWHDGGAEGWRGPHAIAARPVVPAQPRAASFWNGPHAVEWDRDGSLYVTCYYHPGIHRLSAAGAPLGVLGRDVLTGPASAFFDRTEEFLLVAEYSRNAVLILDRDGRVAGRVDGDFDRPHMARALSDGTIAVADTWHNRVERFTAAGAPVSGGASARVACPVALDPLDDGRLLVTAWGEDSVIAIDAGGLRAGRLLTPPLQRPYDARWIDGRAVIADSHHSRVLVIADPRFRA